MFVLGIPGGISAAVILGALTIHGLQPGMRLFKNHPEVIYTIMWGFIGANVLMAFVAVILARGYAHLTLFPRGIIGPLVIVFSIVGVYAGSNNVYDIWLMIALGVLGYFMEKHGFSPAGVLLGLVLGPIAEDGMRNLLIISDNEPLGLILWSPVLPCRFSFAEPRSMGGSCLEHENKTCKQRHIHSSEVAFIV